MAFPIFSIQMIGLRSTNLQLIIDNAHIRVLINTELDRR